MTLIKTACFVGLILIAITGCGPDAPESPLKPTAEMPHMIGLLKTPEEVAAAPTMPATGMPSVTEVGFYTDWKLTKKVTGSVKPGTLIYTKVMFSEAMRHIAADDKTARPVLYTVLDGTRTRLQITQHRASGKNFTHGDSKPRGRGTTTFICKYRIPGNAEGRFTIAVGKQSTDLDGNKLRAFYTHKERLEIEVPPPPFESRVVSGHHPGVRLVYFRPKGKPINHEWVQKAQENLLQAQRDYADLMAGHGFGRKTFAIEADRNGMPIVHHMEGHFGENHYGHAGRGAFKAESEYFDRVPADHHTHLLIIDMERETFGGSGFGGLNYTAQGIRGGTALVRAPFQPVSLIKHELGHAFGLPHDYRDQTFRRIMASGGVGTQMSPDAATWLSASAPFNEFPPGNRSGSITPTNLPKNISAGAKISFRVEDADGLHQVQLSFRDSVVKDTLIAFKPLTGVNETITLTILETSKKMDPGERLTLRIIDKKGGITELRVAR